MSATACVLKSVLLILASYVEVPMGLEPLQGTWVSTSVPLGIVIEGASAKVYSPLAYSEEWIVSQHFRPPAPNVAITSGYHISTKYITSPLEIALEAKFGNQLPEFSAVIDWPTDIPRDFVVPAKGPVRCSVVHTLKGEEATLSFSVPILQKSPPARGRRMKPPSTPDRQSAWTVSFNKLSAAAAKEYSAVTGVWTWHANADAEPGNGQKPIFLIAPGWCAVAQGRTFHLLSTSLGVEKSPRELDIFSTDFEGRRS